MRNHIKIAALVLVGAAAVLASGDSLAGPSGPPPLHVGPSTDLLSFQVHSVISQAAAPPVPYAGGAIELDVGVHNSAATDQAGVTVTITGPGTNLTQTLSVPAKATKTLLFTDPTGLAATCAPKKYVVNITSSAGSHSMPADVIPSCKITATVDDPWNHKEPDRVDEAQKDALYFNNASVVASSCAEGLIVKGNIINHTKISGPSLLVQGSHGAAVTIQTAAAFPLNPGEGKTVTLTPVAGPHDFPDQLGIAIVDWQKRFGSKLVNQGITVKTTKHCTIAGAWEQQAAALATALPPRP